MLTAAQQKHVDSCTPGLRPEMAGILEAKPAAVVYRQTEDSGVPAFALAPANDHAFWINCYRTEKAALNAAKRLGLSASVLPPKH